MNKLLVDTNVLIYSTNYDSKYFDETYKFISDAKYELYTTSKNLSEYLSVITRYPSNPLNISKALGLVDNFVSN
ncbi:MAG: PIN domain-containing protein [Ignavibacteria bacterium]